MSDEEDQPQINPVHLSLQRRNLLMGAEPEALVLLFALIAFMVVIVQGPIMIITGIFLGIGGVFALRRMAKHDPIMIRILRRHFEYQSEYPDWPALGIRPMQPKTIKNIK